MKAYLDTFFTGLWITIQSLTVTEEKDDIFVRIETPDSPLLIGVHGKSIEALQHIIGRIAEKKLWKFIHVHLEVNDYMKSKEEKLFHFLESKISWILQTGKPIQIKNLSSFERKKAHNHIAERNIEGLSTKSEGEWENRVLILQYTWALKISEKPNLTPKKIPVSEKPSDLSSLSEDGVGI